MQPIPMIDKILYILRNTHDGDDLAPGHLYALQQETNHRGTHVEIVDAVYAQVVEGTYAKPWAWDVEHITTDHEGYVYWKGQRVEHYSHDTYSSARDSALELARRCLWLEARGFTPGVNFDPVWNWEEDEQVALGYDVYVPLYQTPDFARFNSWVSWNNVHLYWGYAFAPSPTPRYQEGGFYPMHTDDDGNFIECWQHTKSMKSVEYGAPFDMCRAEGNINPSPDEVMGCMMELAFAWADQQHSNCPNFYEGLWIGRELVAVFKAGVLLWTNDGPPVSGDGIVVDGVKFVGLPFQDRQE